MQFSIDPAIFELFPGMHIPAVYAVGIQVPADEDAITAEWRRVWDETGSSASAYGNAQSHPRVKPWRERFQAAGFSGKKFPSSIESMLRRCLKTDKPFSINSLVDLYNIVSLRHLVPAGGFDVDQLDDDRLDLRFTAQDDTFHSLDADEIESVTPGEVAYATGGDVLTRHFVWRQSQRALLTEGTSRAVFMAEVLGDLPEGVANEVLQDLETAVKTSLSATTTTAMLFVDNPDVRFGAY